MDVDVLKKKKKVLLVVPQPDISAADIKLLRHIQSEKIRSGNVEEQAQHAIVWMPIADKSGKGKEKLESLISPREIEWYTLNDPISHKGTLNFLKEKWLLESKTNTPIVVVMDVPTGKIENITTFYNMHFLGLDAFPFDEETVQTKFREMTWIYTLFKDDSFNELRDLKNWVTETNIFSFTYIYIYSMHYSNICLWGTTHMLGLR